MTRPPTRSFNKKKKGTTKMTTALAEGENPEEDTPTSSILGEIKAADLSKTAIFLGAGVDPDGLASQAVMARILEMWDYTPECFFRGTFNRPQNRIARQVFNLNPKPEEEFRPEDGYTCIISVDGPSTTCPVQPDFIIDHHPEKGEGPKKTSDVRIIGSCSAIMWEYALEAGIDFEDEQGQILATALALGIITDTGFGGSDKASQLDFDALGFCLSHKDNKAYKEVIKYAKPEYYRDLFCLGWQNKVIESAVLVTGIGAIPTGRSGVISFLADEFVETEGVRTAIVFGIVDGALDISVRSENPGLVVNDFVKNAFGGGGGRPGAGRFRIPMPLFENIPEPLSEELFDICFKIVKHKALQMAGDKN